MVYDKTTNTLKQSKPQKIQGIKSVNVSYFLSNQNNKESGE